MPIHYQEETAMFDGQCIIEEADDLLAWIQEHPNGGLDLSRCQHLHASLLQILLQYKLTIVGDTGGTIPATVDNTSVKGKFAIAFAGRGPVKTILIVDDSPTILLSLDGVLSKAGFQVEKAKSGEEALQKLKAGLLPDAVITDFNMPGINGAELVGAIRKMAGFRFKPIFVLTTESNQLKREEAKAMGATAWLVKPVAPDALIGALRKVIPNA